jgi:hypothetical protein
LGAAAFDAAALLAIAAVSTPDRAGFAAAAGGTAAVTGGAAGVVAAGSAAENS